MSAPNFGVKPVIAPITAIIAAGRALSEVVELQHGGVSYIVAPKDWTGEAKISFQISPDGENFYDLFDNAGFEVTRKIIVPYGAVKVDEALTAAAVYIKIRAGSRSNLIEQKEDREFLLILS